jgi:hypothetical protein
MLPLRYRRTLRQQRFGPRRVFIYDCDPGQLQ